MSTEPQPERRQKPGSALGPVKTVNGYVFGAPRLCQGEAPAPNIVAQTVLFFAQMLVFSACLLAIGCLTVPRVEESPAGRILSLDVSTLDGNLEVLTGGEGGVTVVMIWATWCDPCVEALGTLSSIAAGRPEGLDFVAVSVDADPRLLALFVERHLDGPKVLWDPEGRSSSRKLAIERVPTILIIDTEGRIRRVLLGWDRYVERALFRSIETLLE